MSERTTGVGQNTEISRYPVIEGFEREVGSEEIV